MATVRAMIIPELMRPAAGMLWLPSPDRSPSSSTSSESIPGNKGWRLVRRSHPSLKWEYPSDPKLSPEPSG